MRWQYPFIHRHRDPTGMTYRCRVCGHTERSTDKTNLAWCRILKHVNQTHPEKRTVNGRRQ